MILYPHFSQIKKIIILNTLIWVHELLSKNQKSPPTMRMSSLYFFWYPIHQSRFHKFSHYFLVMNDAKINPSLYRKTILLWYPIHQSRFHKFSHYSLVMNDAKINPSLYRKNHSFLKYLIKHFVRKKNN